jgi:hypothetical protein
MENSAADDQQNIGHLPPMPTTYLLRVGPPKFIPLSWVSSLSLILQVVDIGRR